MRVSFKAHCHGQLQYTTQVRAVLCISIGFSKALHSYDTSHNSQGHKQKSTLANKAGPCQ